MKPTVVSGLAMLLLGAASACDGPGKALTHAAATNGCGPTDGPTTVIVLANEPVQSPTAPPDPFVRLTIEEPVSTLAGRSWNVGPQSNAYAAYFFGRTVAQQASSGRVSISS